MEGEPRARFAFCNYLKIYPQREQNPAAPLILLSLLSPRHLPQPFLPSLTSVAWVLAPVSFPGKGLWPHRCSQGVMGCPALTQNRMAARLILGNEHE